jgi:hypothetical protein
MGQLLRVGRGATKEVDCVSLSHLSLRSSRNKEKHLRALLYGATGRASPHGLFLEPCVYYPARKDAWLTDLEILTVTAHPLHTRPYRPDTLADRLPNL